MKKFLKWLLYLVLGLIVLIIAAIFIVPVVFKEDIQVFVQETIEESVEAEAYFDLDKFNLSLISHFPDITVSMEDFGMVGIETFEGDTLANIKSFEIGLDLMSVISGDSIQINGVYLNEPTIFLHVKENGEANWDIAKATEEEEVDTTESKPMSLKIKEWAITNGKIVYDDRQSPMYAKITNLNHSGNGIVGETYTINTNTSMEEISVLMDGVAYLDKHRIASKLDAEIDDKNLSFKFKENSFSLNDFTLNFDGDMGMTETGMVFDLTYGADQTSFKDLLSLIPAVFLDDAYANIATDGSLGFDGALKGEMTDDKLPAFTVNLKVENGAFQYPDIPTSVKNVNIDVNVDNKDGIVDNTVVNLNNLHADLGNNNPIDAKMVIEGLSKMAIDGNVKAKLDLAEVMKIFPVEDLDLKGIFTLDADAKGVYDEVAGSMPSVNANMAMAKGYVKSADYPALENLQFSANANSNGDMAATTLSVKDLLFKMQEDEFRLDADMENFDDLAYDVSASGRIDLQKIMDMFPMEGMELKGIIDLQDFQTKGKMSDIDAENYLAMETSGNMTITDLLYKDADVLDGIKITEAEMSFTPKDINITKYNGFLSKSDISITGTVSNYMGYLFSPTDTIVRGSMNLYSQSFNVDEWMYEEEGAETAETTDEEEAYEIYPIPKNIAFNMDAKFDKVLYDNMGITNMVGTLQAIDGMVVMKDLRMDVFGSKLITNGIYDTRDMTDPKFVFDLDIHNMRIRDAYEYFSVVQNYMPGGDKFEGTFSTRVETSASMDNEYMPIMNTLNADGMIDVHQAVVKSSNMKAIEKAAKLASKNPGDMQINDQKLDMIISHGKLWIKPFKAKIGNMDALVQLNKGFDGSINHFMNMEVPASNVNSALSGLGANVGDKINVDMEIFGTSKDPKAKIVKSGIKNAVKDQVKDHMEQQMNKVNEEIEKEKEKVKEEINKQVEDAKEEVKEEVKDQVKDQVKDTFKGFKWK